MKYAARKADYEAGGSGKVKGIFSSDAKEAPKTAPTTTTSTAPSAATTNAYVSGAGALSKVTSGDQAATSGGEGMISGGVSGAGAGAAIGFATGGPAGAVVGAKVGAVAGGILGGLSGAAKARALAGTILYSPVIDLEFQPQVKSGQTLAQT